MWTSSSNRCHMQWNLWQSTEQKWSWYQRSQWHFQPLSSSTVMTEKEEISKMLDINTIFTWPVIWHYFTAHSHTKSSDPLKLQRYILSLKDIINIVKKQLQCQTINSLRNTLCVRHNINMKRTRYLLCTSSWNSIELKAEVVNRQNYSTYNKLHKQSDSTDLLTAISIVTGCRVMDSVQFW
jgi:hypothetical protein